MCRSVPQIAVFSSLIRTSFGPGAGTGTSSIQMPLVASRLTSAFIICDMGFACLACLIWRTAQGAARRDEIIRPGPCRLRCRVCPQKGLGLSSRLLFRQSFPMPTIRLRLLALSLSLPLVGSSAHANEGMWMPSQLPDIAKQMKAAGFRADPRDLAELAKPPMSAVVKVGGASGAFVTGQGLVLTNHHVAFGVIQYNSKPGRDLIRDGYTAATRADELPANPDYRVLVTTDFDRITDRILTDAKGRQGRAYYDAVDSATKAAFAEC